MSRGRSHKRRLPPRVKSGPRKGQFMARRRATGIRRSSKGKRRVYRRRMSGKGLVYY